MPKEPMVIVNFKVTAEEQRVIEGQARKDKMTVSDYVRSCVYWDMVWSGNLKGMVLLGRRVQDKIAGKLKGLGWVRADE